LNQIPLKEEICERKSGHDEASNCITSLPPDSINHVGDPGTTEDRGEGKGGHNYPYIGLRASMIRNKKRKEEETAKTGHCKKIGTGYGKK